MLNSIVSLFNSIYVSVIDVLPRSPLTNFINALGEIPFLQELNWFIPVGEIIAVSEVWLSAIAVYYLYSAMMRFSRLIK